MSRKQDKWRQVAKRGYWREVDARQLIEAWRSSGESLTQFARQLGVERGRLARWSRRLDGQASLVLHPVRLKPRAAVGADGNGAIEIRLPDDVRIVVPPGFGDDDLRRVLSALAESVSC